MATGSSSGSATRRCRSAGVLARCQSDAPMALHVVSMPAMSSRAIVRATWNEVERLAVELGLEQEGDEVVARVGDVVLDVRLRYSKSAMKPPDPLLEREGDALEHVVHELPELVAVLLRQAEHVGDDPHRDVLGVVIGGVHDVLPLVASSSSWQ